MDEIEKLRDVVVRLKASITEEAGRAAFERMRSSPMAAPAWKQLRAKASDAAGFWALASDLHSDVMVWANNTTPSDKRTKRDINAAGLRAQKLATELADLIHNYSTLQFAASVLGLSVESAAKSRIMRGIAFSGFEFAPEIERLLNELQQRDFPQCSGLTTSEAYRTIEYQYAGSEAFEARLRLFAKYAEESARDAPIAGQPQSARADQRVLANMLCATMNHHVGSPCIEICTSFVAAVCDDPSLDNELVKKWWQRRGDKSY